MNGRSPVLRIPKASRLLGSKFEIVHEGDRVVLIPEQDTWSAALLGLLNRSEEPLERPSRARPHRSVVLD